MQARTVPTAEEMARRILRGEERALARLLSALEDGEPWAGVALRILRKESASGKFHDDAERSSAGEPRMPPQLARIVGITGPPGSGKSTLVDKLIDAYRERGERVAVLAVDPSSPFSGGAILGDRIRMQGSLGGARASDGGVFIRSLASRGRLGGLSRASAQCSHALEAAGYGIVLVETVGIGQSEVDIVRIADSVVLVTMPGSGDDIQTIKAGVMEIGDIFVVNKADREGADKTVREIRAMLETAASLASGQALASLGGPDTLIGHHAFGPVSASKPVMAPAIPPVLKTVAETGEGVGELVVSLDAHWAGLKASGELEERRRRGAIAEARALLSDRVLAELEGLEGGLEDRLADEIVRGEREAMDAAEILFDSIRKGGER
jgi:LAO/AO transport system kinase